MDDTFFKTGNWVEIEDMYDHDYIELGPFPSAEAAHEFCDAYNGKQLSMPDGGIPDEIGQPQSIGVWNKAYINGYPFGDRMKHFLAHPEDVPPDHEAIQKRYGVKYSFEWRQEINAAISPTECWCEPLRNGRIPDVSLDLVAAYVDVRLKPERSLFSTSQHHGDLSEMRCQVCHGAVLHLLIELEGFGNAIHHYYTPIDKTHRALIGSAELGPTTYEEWAGGRAGIHRDGGRVQLYARAQVGYPGMDHKILTPNAAAADTVPSPAVEPEPARTAPPIRVVPACPQCDGPTRWVAEHDRFRCDPCKVYLVTE